jgi:hypothetical protein
MVVVVCFSPAHWGPDSCCICVFALPARNSTVVEGREPLPGHSGAAKQAVAVSLIPNRQEPVHLARRTAARAIHNHTMYLLGAKANYFFDRNYRTPREPARAAPAPAQMQITV